MDLVTRLIISRYLLLGLVFLVCYKTSETVVLCLVLL